MSVSLSSIVSGVVAALLLIAAVTDISTLRIPNWISGTILALFVVLAVVTQLSFSTVAMHLVAGIAVLAGGAALFAWGKLGGGDVKLLTAVATWVGSAALFKFILAVGLVGGISTLATVALRNRALVTAIRDKGYRLAALEPNAGGPYAVAIAGGFFFLLFTQAH